MSVTGCVICGDPRVKFHYGTLSCAGCKAFFRRTVRLDLKYECRRGTSGHCVVEGNRNSCRACRYQRCIRAGMNRDAVQRERDYVIRKKPKKPNVTALEIYDSQSSIGDNLAAVSRHYNEADRAFFGYGKGYYDLPAAIKRMSFQALAAYVAENYKPFLERIAYCDAVIRKEMKRLASDINWISPQNPLNYSDVANGVDAPTPGAFRVATFSDCYKLMKPPLLACLKLMTNYDMFRALPLADQVALARGNAAQAILLSDVKRSLSFDNFLLLSDERHILRRKLGGPNCTVPHCNIVNQILDDLIAPLRSLEVDSTEFACMRAIGFWNADICSKESKDYVRKQQQLFMVALERYISEKPMPSPGRLGNLMLLLKTSEAIAKDIRGRVQQATILNEIDVDPFTDDLFQNVNAPIGVLQKLIKQPLDWLCCKEKNGQVCEPAQDPFCSPVITDAKPDQSKGAIPSRSVSQPVKGIQLPKSEARPTTYSPPNSINSGDVIVSFPLTPPNDESSPTSDHPPAEVFDGYDNGYNYGNRPSMVLPTALGSLYPQQMFQSQQQMQQQEVQFPPAYGLDGTYESMDVNAALQADLNYIWSNSENQNGAMWSY